MNESTVLEVIPVGYVPSYFLYVVLGVLLACFIGLTYAYKSKKTNWGNFWQVALFSTSISGIVTWFLVMMPEIFATWVTKLIVFLGF